jgi:uncharacterized protein YciI
MTSTAAQDIMRAMLNKPLYAALRQPVDLSRVAALLEDHLRWAIGAEHRGELFASGPFVAEGFAPGALGGLSILRADSVEEAQRIIQRDPFIREGVFKADVKRWMLMEGGLTLTVRFSDRSARIL